MGRVTGNTDLHFVEDFAGYFSKSPDKLGLEHLRTYQAYLLKQRKLSVGSVVNQIAALRFFSFVL